MSFGTCCRPVIHSHLPAVLAHCVCNLWPPSSHQAHCRQINMNRRFFIIPHTVKPNCTPFLREKVYMLWCLWHVYVYDMFTTFYKVHRRSHTQDDFHGFLLSIERSPNVPYTLLTFCNFNWIWTTQVICPLDDTGRSQNDICIDELAAAIILGLNGREQLQWNSPEPVKINTLENIMSSIL